jgi:hypothetical protein
MRWGWGWSWGWGWGWGSGWSWGWGCPTRAVCGAVHGRGPRSGAGSAGPCTHAHAPTVMPCGHGHLGALVIVAVLAVPTVDIAHARVSTRQAGAATGGGVRQGRGWAPKSGTATPAPVPTCIPVAPGLMQHSILTTASDSCVLQGHRHPEAGTERGHDTGWWSMGQGGLAHVAALQAASHPLSGRDVVPAVHRDGKEQARRGGPGVGTAMGPPCILGPVHSLLPVADGVGWPGVCHAACTVQHRVAHGTGGCHRLGLGCHVARGAHACHPRHVSALPQPLHTLLRVRGLAPACCGCQQGAVCVGATGRPGSDTQGAWGLVGCPHRILTTLHGDVDSLGAGNGQCGGRWGVASVVGREQGCV